MKYVAKFFVVCALLGVASHVQAARPQAGDRVIYCKPIVYRAKLLVQEFYRRGKTDFPAFIDEKRVGLGGASKGFGAAVGGIKGFAAGFGLGLVSKANFERAVNLLIGLGLYEDIPDHIGPQDALNRLEKPAIIFCVNKMF